MKKIIYSLLISLVFIFVCSSWSIAMTLEASSAILIDAATGRVIFQQNAHESRAVASTTKILTALLVLENVKDLDHTVTLPADFVNIGESTIDLEPGDTHTYRDLLYALMLRSANDAAQALAIGVGGSEEGFATMMNERTADLGLVESHWINAHGLDEDKHYSSAYDLAMITRQAVTIDMFNTLVTADSYSLPWATSEADLAVYRHNQFIDLYKGADGIKTGYTALSGPCLVASATRNGMRLIGVVLNSPNHYGEMALMMDFGFNNYEPLPVAKAGDIVGNARIIAGRTDNVDLVLGSDVTLSVEAGNTDFVPEISYQLPLVLEAPFTTETIVGTVTYTDSSGKQILIDVYPAETSERYTFGIVLKQVWQRFLAVFL